MKKLLLILALIPSLAQAKDMTVTFTDQDQQALVAALDAYVKAGGINVATSAVVVLQKLQQAAQAPDQPKQADLK